MWNFILGFMKPVPELGIAIYLVVLAIILTPLLSWVLNTDLTFIGMSVIAFAILVGLTGVVAYIILNRSKST